MGKEERCTRRKEGKVMKTERNISREKRKGKEL
jgi:hypothetical protein